MLNFKSITAQEINTSPKLSGNGKAWALGNLEYINKPMPRVFSSSVKVAKGNEKRTTRVLYLAPAGSISKATLCHMAEAAGCEKDCLTHSGMLGLPAGQDASAKRTVLYLLRRDAFLYALSEEIHKGERKALKEGVPALWRLNGTSDINWLGFIQDHPESEFYDYSKSLSYTRNGNALANYDVTYSGSMFSEQSRRALGKAVKRGVRIAVAYNSKGIKGDTLPLPQGDLIPSFDVTDLRPLDGQVMGYLSRKGSNKAQRARENKVFNSFFITEANIEAFKTITGAK